MNYKNFNFEKVSFEEYSKERVKLFGERPDEYLREEYDSIQLPRRATSGSAGYDFFCPFPINNIGDSCTFGNSGLNMKRKEVTIPTGIRWISDDDSLVLLLMPRSGLGFKYRIQLNNTCAKPSHPYLLISSRNSVLKRCKIRCKNPIS